MAFPFMNEKTELLIDKAEIKMKRIDKKIKLLKYELYGNVSSLQSLRNQNLKITELTDKMEPVHEDLFIYPDTFSYFQSLQDKLNENSYFMNIIDVLKNEVYKKPDMMLLDENPSFRCIVFPEKTIYSQWILQTIIKKISEKFKVARHVYDFSLETLLYLEKIMTCCNISVADVYPPTLSILDNASFKILSDNEQDLLIFMHATAQMQTIFDLMKTIDFKQNKKQLLFTKAERCELQKRYVQLLNELKHLVDDMKDINISRVFDAITKSSDVQVEAKDIAEAYENFKRYITQVSGQRNIILDISQFEDAASDDSVNNIIQKLNDKIHQSNHQTNKETFENFDVILNYNLFQKDIKSLIIIIKEFIERMSNMCINDIDDALMVLNYLKAQVNLVFISKWNLQKQLLPFICENNEALLLTGRFQLLVENIKHVMFYLRILEEIEFNKHFSVMAGLCDLREKRDLLVEKFRNFIIRIGYQKTKHVPIIKAELLEYNKEVQILLGNYQKFKFKLQFFNINEDENLQNMFNDIQAGIMTDEKDQKQTKYIGYMAKRKVDIPESESSQKRTTDNLEEISKIVDETMEYLHSLDEKIISKKFSGMRYLCELYCLKEQILSSFEGFLSAMFKLNINDNEAIISRLNLMSSAARSLIRRYEAIGAQLMIFSDIMQIVHKQKTATLSLKQCVGKDYKMNVSDLFGKTDDVKKLHNSLDKAVKHKWFPSKQNLGDMLKEKERTIQVFLNFLERLPEFDIENTMDIMHSLTEAIMDAENILRRYQNLRMQLIWISGDCVFNIMNVRAK